ncbi:TRAP transporter permease [Natrialbaceae archaeon GCM10025810]|uniref:TRAP transporter permease n=1 Tax=Halovalidus salilacus TaxID=3075124 RepID=UPI0036122357
MEGTNRDSDRTILRVLDPITATLAVGLTAYTVGYAILLLTGWPAAFDVVLDKPGWLSRTERYMIVFLGVGLALYYFDYARRQLGDERGGIGGLLAETSAEDEEADATSGTSSSASGADQAGALDRVRDAVDRVDPYVAVAFGIVALATMWYVYTNFGRLDSDSYLAGFETADHVVGALLIILAIDSTRRAFGTAISGVAVLAIAYTHESVAPLLGGILGHSGENWESIVEDGAIAISGVYDSTLMGIGSTWVAIFIMFAGLAKAFGLMDFVRTVGKELGSSLRTGVVQVAVISSMIMGSITGSAAANTATTGSFTIPMIKDQGVRDDVAGSIEAVASAGGQMLPPVMGVAAFLMADIIGVSYLEIVRAGVVPAALFYLSVCVAVHFTILKFGWTARELSPFSWNLLLGGVHFAIPMGVLLYTLIYKQYTPLTSGMYTIFTIVGVMFVRNALVDAFAADERVRATVERTQSSIEGQPTSTALLEVASLIPRSLAATGRNVARGALDGATVKRAAASTGRSVLGTARQTVDGFKQGGLEMAPLVGVLAAMGVIVKLLDTTGLPGRVATTIIGLGDVSLFGFGGGLFVVLFLAMIASILFGLGMPTPAAYVLVAALVTRPVTEMGVPDITTHMFVFYFAMLSAITPPVAISVAIGARLAGASFTKTAVQALKLGAPGFVIPYAFVANNSLISWSQETLVAFPVVLAGTVGLIVATVGFDGARDLSPAWRIGYVAVSLAAMFGSIGHVAIQVAAAAIIVAGLGYANVVVGYDADARRRAEPSASD